MDTNTDPVRALIESHELYSLLTDVSNGIDSPATCAIASRLVCHLDRAREALAQQPAATSGEAVDHRYLARDIHRAIMDAGLAPLPPAENNALRETILRALNATQQPAGVDEAVDPALLSFYGVEDYPSLVAAMEAHVLKLIDTHKRNVKPWEDTFPQTLLPRFIREQGVVPTKEGLALAQKWEDEAAESWGEDPRHQAKQECCEELRALVTAALAAQQQG